MKIKSLIFIGCLMACVNCPAVFAQEDYSRYEIFGGYSLLKVGEYDHMDIVQKETGFDKKSNLLDKGFSLSFTYNFNPVIGLETSLRRNTGYVLSSSVHSGNVDATIGFKRTDFAFLAGPRFTFRNEGRVTPFIHVLAGVSHDDIALGGDISDGSNADSDYVSLESHSSFGFAVGGGLDISINDSWAIRAFQAEYYMTNHPILPLPGLDEGNKLFSNFNVAFGVVYRFGK